MPQPAAAQLASKPAIEAVTAVRITDRCRSLSTRVKAPAETAGKDLRDLRLEYKAALKLANTKLGATDACLERLVALYHQGLKP